MKPINILWAIANFSGCAVTFVIAASGGAWWSLVIMAVIAFVSTWVFNDYLGRHYEEVKRKRHAVRVTFSGGKLAPPVAYEDDILIDGYDD